MRKASLFVVAAAVVVLQGCVSEYNLATGQQETLLYGVEVKFYSNRLELTQGLETEVRGLYACGDGAGITRGLVQASASGLMAARAILGD